MMQQSTTQLQFAALLEGNRGIIYQMFNRYFEGRDWHDDLFQDVALAGWKSYSNFKNECNFTTWISRIARNIAVDKLRRLQAEARRLPKCLHWFSFEPYEEYPMPVFDTLSNVERITLQYRLEGRTFEEIAYIMQEPVPRLLVRMHRIKQRLGAQIKRQQLED
jgi:RNA polymerase sigma-70 factor (ECF subfamily)